LSGSAIRRAFLAGVLAAGLTVAGCSQRMDVDPKNEPLSESGFFPYGQTVRPQVAGTVARESAGPNDTVYTGKVNGQYAGSIPLPLTRELLERGHQRFNIYCSPCHGRLGDGQGMIVQRGLQGPVSFHEQRFLDYPPGYFFDVITNGRGAMYPYGYRIAPRDRWAIIAYIRALQLSQNASVNDVPPDRLAQMRGNNAP
jgi:mono/diheme cytochrome c family protein